MEFTVDGIMKVLNASKPESINLEDCLYIMTRLNIELSRENKEWLAERIVQLIHPSTRIEDISDGYHSYKELYEHRNTLFACLCMLLKDNSWFSMQHADPVKDPMYKNMFIAGITTPYGDCTYHCEMQDIDKFTEVVREISNAPKFDGHTPTMALNRIYNYCSHIRAGDLDEQGEDEKDTKGPDINDPEVGFVLIRSTVRCANMFKLGMSEKDWRNGPYHQFYMTMVINLMDLGYSVTDISYMLKEVCMESGGDWPFVPIE